MKAVAGILKTACVLVYIVIFLSLAIASPILFGYRPVVVLSPSMQPAYPVGSIIYYKKAAFEDISVGDVITFRLGDSSLGTHRVVEIDVEKKSFTTKGDNNPSNDINPVEYSRVAGKATSFAVPYAGYFTKYVQRWQMVVLMGGILLLGLLTVPDKKKKLVTASEYFKDL